MECPNRIRELRKERNMTLKKLSGMIDISIAYLSDIEKGNRHGSQATISRIADALGVAEEDLFSNELEAG